MNELLESVPGVGTVAEALPGGGWTLAAVGLLALPRVWRTLRPAAKLAVRGGLVITDQVKGLVREVRSGMADLVAEARAEQQAT